MNLVYSVLAPPNPPPDPETLRTAIARDPDNARLHHDLGIALLADEDIEGAAASIERSLALAPAEPHAYRALGQIHLIRRELAVARSSFEQAIALDPDDVDAHAQLAVILILCEETVQARQILWNRLESRPDVPLLWANLAAALRVDGYLEDAIDAYRRALDLDPTWIYVRADVATLLFACGRFSEAVAECRRIVELDPDTSELLTELGSALYANGELEEALEVYERAVALSPEWDVPLQNAASVACALRELERAANLFRRTLDLDPRMPEAHFDLGLMALHLGDYAEGFREYEWRWPCGGATFHRPELQVPLWDGSPLAGRSLLVWSEQGRGDIIQFARFLSRIPKEEGRIILHTPPKLARLLTTVEGVDQVVADGDWLEADVQFPLLSLPCTLGITLETLGDTPYLRPPEASAVAEELIPRDGTALNVGCVWASGPHFKHHRKRDVEAHRMAGLASVPGVRMFSLQWGERALDATPYAGRMTDLSEVIGDFGTTAAFVDRLDLIITVDTAMAHLAGALGKPVWLLLNKRTDWRWLDDRSDSPWYPTMRIYRQSRVDDWEDAFELVTRDLGELARSRGCTGPAAPPLDPQVIPRTVFVKQYGERRTGTNFLRTLLATNYHAEVLMHLLGDKHSPPAPFDRYWKDAQGEPNPARAFVCRATFSAPSLTTSPLSLEQIAEATHFEKAIASAFAGGELRFVVSIRDPYAWAASLGWFLGWAPRGEMVPPERTDELRYQCLQFNQRYTAWMDLAEWLPSRTFFVRYEELRADPEAVCETLARALGLTRRSRVWRAQEQTVLPATWDDDPGPRLGETFDRDTDNARHLSPECRDVVAETIDWALVEQIYARASATYPSA